jgi:hypothetical protein
MHRRDVWLGARHDHTDDRKDDGRRKSGEQDVRNRRAVTLV